MLKQGCYNKNMSKNSKTDEKILEIPKKGGPFVVVEKNTSRN